MRVLIAVLALLLSCSLAAAQRYQTILSGGTHAFSPQQIDVGQSATLPIQARCFDTKKGGYVNDVVQLYITRGPSAAKFVNTVTTSMTSDPRKWPRAKLQTTLSTPPGIYAGSATRTIQFKGVGRVCGLYKQNVSSTGYITIRPTLKAEGDFWWLNGHLDENPDYREVKLVAGPPGRTYTFSVLYPDRYAEILDGKRKGGTIRTTNRTVTLTDKRLPWKAAPNKADFFSTKDYPFRERSIAVSVTVNGAASETRMIPLRMPYEIELLSGADVTKRRGTPTKNPRDEGGPIVEGKPNLFGHISILYYRVLDQKGDELPKPVWLRENFFFPNGPAQRGIPYLKRPTSEPNNWVIGAEGDKAGPHPSDPSFVTDFITGQSAILGPDPTPLPPGKPLGHEDMGYWTGSLSVGSKTKYDGVVVATITWQKFRDHARHCDVLTPMTETLVKWPCPLGAE